MSATEFHQLLGAYLLGGLEPDEAAAFEQHLGGCAACRRGTGRTRQHPGAAGRAPGAGRRCPWRRCRGHRGRAGTGDSRSRADRRAAAAPRPTVRAAPEGTTPVDRGARGGGSGMPGARHPGRAVVQSAAQTGRQLLRPGRDGLQITVGMVKKTWGTELAVEGRSLPVDGTLSLWVTASDGGEERACAWTATPSGRVRITGATPLQLADIASVQMRNGQQQTMAVIAVPRG
ncbi:zf-HC2 domain-containing protein [Pseudarthrobacter sp. So.54]